MLPTKIHDVIKTAHDKSMHVVGIDLSENPSSENFEQCDIPYVMCTGGTSANWRYMRGRNALAVVDDDFNKYARAVEEAFEDLGKRFPGLFRTDWTVEGYECKPEHEQQSDRCTERMMESIDRLMGYGTAETSIKKIRNSQQAAELGVPKNYLTNHTLTEVKFKSKDQTSCLKFEFMYAGDKAEAEGIADSTLFLAKKCSMGARPRTYTMTQVMEEQLRHKDVDQQERERERGVRGGGRQEGQTA